MKWLSPSIQSSAVIVAATSGLMLDRPRRSVMSVFSMDIAEVLLAIVKNVRALMKRTIRTMNNKDTEVPERIRLVKREGRFANEWYYPDAAIMPFEKEFQYARVDPPAAPTEDAVQCPVCKDEVPEDSMFSYNNVPNAFCQGCVDSGRV